MKIKKILIFDTSVATNNLGDLIIVDSVKKEIRELFPNHHVRTAQTHDIIGKHTYSLNSDSDHSFIAGTNLLSSNMNSYNQWKINLFDSFYLDNILLMGVGWWQYQKNPNHYTKYLLRKVLSRKMAHSVRDEYTKSKMANTGFLNVINTGCPSMWKLTPSHCADIPSNKSNAAVFTVTDYNKNSLTDINMISTIKRIYQKVFFWPQGTGDMEYLNNLGVHGIEFISPSLESYDDFLSSHESIDYVGTRLHAGIRALQHRRRSLIIAVDNRAAEIQKDTNLPVLNRGEIDRLAHMLKGGFETKVKLKEADISLWKSQFESAL